MKYLYAILNLTEMLLAMFGFYVILMTSISVLSGEGTLQINGHCFGKCPIEESLK